MGPHLFPLSLIQDHFIISIVAQHISQLCQHKQDLNQTNELNHSATTGTCAGAESGVWPLERSMSTDWRLSLETGHLKRVIKPAMTTMQHRSPWNISVWTKKTGSVWTRVFDNDNNYNKQTNKQIKQQSLYFLVLWLPTCRKHLQLTSSVVLMVVDELWNGAEEVLLSKVECDISSFGLFDLVMFHIGSFLTICPAGNKEWKSEIVKSFLPVWCCHIFGK